MKKKVNQLNKENEPHGLWEVYWGKDKINLRIRGNYVNGYAHGYLESYHEDGKPDFKGTYENGRKKGLCEWYVKGELVEQVYYV